MSATRHLQPEVAHPAQRGEHMSAPKFRAALTSLALVGAATLSVVAVSAPAEAATAPVPVSISKKRIVTMPTVVQPGVNTFAVSTKRSGRTSSWRMPAAGYTAEEAARDIEKGLDQGKIKQLKRFEANVTLARWHRGHRRPPGHAHRDAGARHLLGARHRRPTTPAKFFAFTVAGARHRQRHAGVRDDQGQGRDEVGEQAGLDPEQGSAHLHQRREPEPLRRDGQAQEGQDASRTSRSGS